MQIRLAIDLRNARSRRIRRLRLLLLRNAEARAAL